MAGNSKSHSSRKRPVSQKRVAIVLASLVGTMTLTAGALLLMEPGALSSLPPGAFAVTSDSMHRMIRTNVPLQRGVWQRIIIYESGDVAGSAASLAEGRVKGVGPNVGNVTRQPAYFHFVVDGASSRSGALDGELEVGSTWRDQKYGTPHIGWPDNRYNNLGSYINAVGVCVCGSVDVQPYSEAQCRTLVQLVHELQQELGLDTADVLFQWELNPNSSHATPAQIAFARDFKASL